MDLDKLYEMQKELDNYIWEKHGTLEKMSKEELLDNITLALQVEIAELANTTRCFKIWSTKGMMGKEIVLEELSDVLHFYLSIGNQLEMKWSSTWNSNQDRLDISKENTMTGIFKKINYWATRVYDKMTYQYVGEWIFVLVAKLNFTDQEVEQAYLKKHEENYRRQEEGY